MYITIISNVVRLMYYLNLSQGLQSPNACLIAVKKEH